MNIIKLLVFIIVTALAFESHAAAGFKDGDSFSVQPVRSSITLYCYNGDGRGTTSRFYNCNNEYISPVAYSRFVNDSGVSAKKVRLQVTRANCSVKTKTKKWSNKKEQSRSFNLWIGSLLQRPLLDIGANQISYEMLAKSGEVVESGEFNVNVERKPAVVCAHRTFNAYNNDCSFPDAFCRRVYRDGYNCH